MVKNALILLAVVCLLLSILLWVGCVVDSSESPDNGGGEEAWVERYGGVRRQHDEPHAIAVDEAGNVYVTGYIVMGGSVCSNYATVKYDSNGDRLWTAHYDGPAGQDDRAEAIVLDDSGNVYVVGQSDGGDTNEDYAVVKYDTDGNELWVSRYDGPAHGCDVGCAIAVDSSGNVCVSGYSTAGTTYDYATVKYNSSGEQVWASRYDGPAGQNDRAEVIALDDSGNVYVAGRSDGGDTGWDYAVVKYDSDGNELWVSRYDGPVSGDDWICGAFVDGSGNIYVSGTSNGPGTSWDYATLKYDTDGNPLWVARHDGSRSGSDTANTMAVDAAGNIYVMGDSNNVPTIVKYDTDGNELWAIRTSWGRDVVVAAVDGSGNLHTSVLKRQDCSTVKYNSDGDRLWVADYNGPAAGKDEPCAMVVDEAGNVYVAVCSDGVDNGRDWAIIKYTQ